MSERKRKVFIINKGVHDYTAAEPFGELVFLSIRNLKKFATSQIYRIFMPILRKSDPEDYILPTGLLSANLVATYIMTQLHERVNLLLFKPGKGGRKEYIERILK